MAESKSSLSDFEKAALKERQAELREEATRERAAARGAAKAEAELADALAKIAALPEADRLMAEQIHELILSAAPQLRAKSWYGMPAYTLNGKIVCFFQGAGKFESRYHTLGFNDAANLDDGNMWPTAYALTTLGRTEKARIVALVQQAASGRA